MSDPAYADEDRFTILDYLLPLIRWRWLIFLGTILAGVAGVLVAFQIPSYYRATAYFVPKGAMGDVDELRALLGGSSDKNWQAAGRPTELAQYFSVAMKVRPLIENLLQRDFDTAKQGKTALLETVVRKKGDPLVRLDRGVSRLRKRVLIDVGGSKLLTVTYTAAEPKLAADVANAVLDEYNKLPKRTMRASADMKFLQERIQEIRGKLEEREAAIGQEKSKALDSRQPDAVLRIASVEREAKFYQDLLQQLNMEYAKAEIRMIQGQRETTQEIEVVDPAVAPMTPSGPDKKKIVIVFLVVGAVLTSGFALTREYVRNLQTTLADHPFWSFWKKSRRDIIVMIVLAILALIAAGVFFYLRVRG